MSKKLDMAGKMLAKIEADNKFEAEVIYQIEVQGEMTTSDAQGILEAQDFLYMQLLCTDKNPAEVAKEIITKSIAK